jgi:dolichol-phosphate mannosyltransferase
MSHVLTAREAGLPAATVMPGPELSVVIPTFNERENVEELCRRLSMQLAGVEWEAVFVDDDSRDGTAEILQGLARDDRRVRVIRRIGRRGLASACIEGMLASSAPYLAVMDADLQHDEALLPAMLAALREDADLVIASRYTASGDVEGWDERRRWLSRTATRLSRIVTGVDITDPMSGFFMMRRAVFDNAMRELSGLGFKLLLDILASSPTAPRVRELPYRFRPRAAGTSKLDSMAVQDFLLLLLDKGIGRQLPARFVMFIIVGAFGTLVHLMILWVLFRGLGLEFLAAQATATLAAMLFNYAVNNELTYWDQRLRGRAWLRGCASFVLACSIGAVANVGVAGALFAGRNNWLISAASGVLVGTVWNYVATAFYTWGRR